MLQVFNYNAGKGDCIRLRYTGLAGTPHNILIDSGVIRFGLEFEAICRGTSCYWRADVDTESD